MVLPPELPELELFELDRLPEDELPEELDLPEDEELGV